MARPSSLTPEVAAAICDRIASGESVKKICASADMPDASTVFRWLAADKSFCDQYMRARESRADARFEEVDQIKADLRAGEIDANAARVLIDAVKWQTGKENAKRYGDRLELGGDKDAPLQTRVVVEFVDSPKAGE
jgi:hypothetical protein